MPSPSTVLLRTQSDERLVALVRAGHDRAFDAIVERYRKPLLRACLRILPEARAEDALQQALVAAWKGLKRGDDIRDLRPWLYRIVRNTALNQLRVAGYDLDELVETLSAAHDPEEEVMRRAVVRQTLAAVAALPERQREALLRMAVDGHGQEEVARDLGLSDTAVRALVHRARVRVRAAATAVVPLPLAAWAAGAGGTGAAVTLAKAGTLAVLAGGAVTAPALIHEHGAAPPNARRAEATPKPSHAGAAARAAPTPAPVVSTRTVADTAPRAAAPTATHRSTTPADRPEASGDERERSGPGGDDRDREARTGPRGDDGAGQDDRRGPGGDDGGHRGPGGGTDDDEATAPTATPTPVAGTAEDGHHDGGGDDATRDGGGDGSSGARGELDD